VAWTHTRSKIAQVKKSDPEADVTDLRRQMKAERLEAHIDNLLSTAPPLTNEQRDRIARLIAPTGGGAR